MPRLKLILLAAFLAAPAAAQDNTAAPGTVIGPPQLKDFDLAPGRERPQQPAPEQPQPQPAPPVEQARPQTPPATVPATTPVEQPRRTPSAPAARETAPPEVTPETLTPDIAAPAATAPASPPLANQLTPPVEPAPAAEEPLPAEPRPPGGFPWIAVAAGVGLALLAGLLLLRRRRRDAVPSQPEPAAEPEKKPFLIVEEPLPARPQPAPEPARHAEPAQSARPAPRPWLEVEFKPQRASAADDGASVHFELLVRNRGDAPARNVRVEGRMFNAGADHEAEIRAFYASPPPSQNVPNGPTLQPGGTTMLKGSVSMPRDKLREVEIQGRRLFVPMVGFNVHYEWGQGEVGRNSTSYLVGREPQAPSQKMGAFRLDLGPRIYRSLGQRPTPLARMV